MTQIQIKRGETPGVSPAALAPGELAVEMGVPTRLWVGVPVALDPSGQKLLLDGAQDFVNTTGDVMSGPLTLPGPPTDPLHAATKGYVDGLDLSAYLLKSGGAMTGYLSLIPDAPTFGEHAANKAYVDAGDAAGATAVSGKVAKAGDVMSGLLTLAADPVAALDAATKQYVDARAGGMTEAAADAKYVNAAGDVMTGSLAINVPAGYSDLFFQKDGVNRFMVRGADIGNSNFEIHRYGVDGAYLGSSLSINATNNDFNIVGNMTFPSAWGTNLYMSGTVNAATVTATGQVRAGGSGNTTASAAFIASGSFGGGIALQDGAWHALIHAESGNLAFHTNANATPDRKLYLQGDGNHKLYGGLTATAQVRINADGDVFSVRNASYGMIFHHNTSQFYMMVTNANDPQGGWNTLRPFMIDYPTGNVNLGHAVSVGSTLNVAGGCTAPSFTSGPAFIRNDGWVSGTVLHTDATLYMRPDNGVYISNEGSRVVCNIDWFSYGNITSNANVWSNGGVYYFRGNGGIYLNFDGTNFILSGQPMYFSTHVRNQGGMGTHHYDTTPCAPVVANGGAIVAYGGFSGIVVSNCYTTGGCSIFIMGAGQMLSISTAGHASTSCMYDGAGNYYFFNNSGGDAQFSVFAVRTRPSA